MIPGTDLSRCRCGTAFKFIGYGKRLCPPCMAGYRARQAKDFSYPKCRCGSVLGLDRVRVGMKLCGRCADSELQRRRSEALDRFADSLLENEK